MSRLSRKGEALRAFRLSDLPPHVREWGVAQFTEQEIERCGGEFAALSLVIVAQVKHAAECPSEDTYWISEKAYVRLLRKFKLDPEFHAVSSDVSHSVPAST
jgi:hypothetical protein